ncbi:MAG: HlyD family secretion protein [Gammaproteobacteria bacterium]
MTRISREKERPEVALRHAWLWVLPALVFLCACSEDAADYWQGYVEGDYVYVSAAGSGRLLERHVVRGGRVERGAPLFKLEQDREIAIRDEALARWQSALASLEDLQKGKRSEELDIIEAQLAQAQATLRLSRIQLQRQQALFAKKTVPKASLDEARTVVERERGRVRELEAELATAHMAARSDAIRAAQAEVDAARAALAQGEWELAQKTRQAPEDAMVVDTFFEPGEWVAAGRPVVSLLPAENIKVRFYVPEEALGALAIGDPLELRCDGCPGDLRVEVSYISPEAEYTPPVIYSRETRDKLVYRIEARPGFSEPYRLHPGQPVEVWQKRR